jgi:hypothetical protein
MSDKSPNEIIDGLSGILLSLVEFNLRHDSCIDDIDSIMSNLYVEETRVHNEDTGNIDEDDEDYMPDAPFYSLINYVEDKEQYINDLKNAIRLRVLSENNHDHDTVISKIIDLRN